MPRPTTAAHDLTEADLQDALQGVLMHDEPIADAIDAMLGTDENTPAVRAVRTFEEAGVLTMDKGLVVRFDTGAEFQITIKRSR